MLMLLATLDRRLATVIRLVGLVLAALSVLSGSHSPGTSGRGLVVSVLFVAAALSWLIWTARPDNERWGSLELYLMAGAGGLLVVAAPQSAASVFVFVAVIVAGVRMELARAAPVALLGVLAVAVSDLLYNGSALGLLAYALGFVASLLAASKRASAASGSSRPSSCWRRPSARTKSSCARRAWRSRPGSRAISTTCSPTPWRA